MELRILGQEPPRTLRAVPGLGLKFSLAHPEPSRYTEQLHFPTQF